MQSEAVGKFRSKQTR